jgi:hypothetical protein
VFLVAWEQGTGSDVRVYVARVSTAGAVLDAAGIAVATGGFDEQYDPAVAFDGTNFLVTYSVGLSAGGQIAAVRIGPSGNRLDTTAITVSRITSPYAEAQGTPAVAFDGTNYLVVWQDDRGDWWDIYGNRVTPGGMVLDGNGFAVDATPVSGLEHAADRVRRDQLPRHLERLAGRGLARVLGLRPPRQPGRRREPDADRDRHGGGRAKQPHAGVGGRQLPCRVAGRLAQHREPDRRHARQPRRHGARSGRPDAGGFVHRAQHRLRAGAGRGRRGQVLLAWSGTNIRAARITAAGASRDGADGFALSGAPNTQQDPAVAFDGRTTWSSGTDSRTRRPEHLRHARQPQGAILDTAGSGSRGRRGQGRPSIAWNGKHYLVSGRPTA